MKEFSWWFKINLVKLLKCFIKCGNKQLFASRQEKARVQGGELLKWNIQNYLPITLSQKMSHNLIIIIIKLKIWNYKLLLGKLKLTPNHPSKWDDLNISMSKRAMQYYQMTVNNNYRNKYKFCGMRGILHMKIHFYTNLHMIEKGYRLLNIEAIKCRMPLKFKNNLKLIEKRIKIRGHRLLLLIGLRKIKML